MENGEYVERIGGLESGSGVCGETKGNPTSLPIPPPPHRNLFFVCSPVFGRLSRFEPVTAAAATRTKAEGGSIGNSHH